jgi:hypothetical protein
MPSALDHDTLFPAAKKTTPPSLQPSGAPYAVVATTNPVPNIPQEPAKEVESDYDYANRLKSDEQVIAMSVELDDEQFSTWLDNYTGEDNSI